MSITEILENQPVKCVSVHHKDGFYETRKLFEGKTMIKKPNSLVLRLVDAYDIEAVNVVFNNETGFYFAPETEFKY